MAEPLPTVSLAHSLVFQIVHYLGDENILQHDVLYKFRN